MDPPPLSPQHFHTDGLHCIFRMLALADAIPAFRTCRDWMAAGCKERGRGVTLAASKARVANACASPLRHHIAELRASPRDDQYREESYSPTNLALLHRLPNLTAVLGLRLSLDSRSLDTLGLDSDSACAPLFPASLHTLSISVDQDAETRFGDRVIDAISQIRSLTSLVLDVKDSRADLSPLLSLTQLRCFDFAAMGYVHISVIRQFAALEQLVLRDYLDDTAVEEMCAPGHALTRLRQLEFGRTYALSERDVKALASLPSLDTLKSSGIQPAAVALLPFLPALRTVVVNTAVVWRSSSDLAKVLPGIMGCRGLTDLTLQSNKVTEDDLAQLAAALPGLTALSLLQCVTGSVAPIRGWSKLQSLTMTGCPQMTVAFVSALAPLPRLRSLFVGLTRHEMTSARTLRRLFPALVELRVVKLE